MNNIVNIHGKPYMTVAGRVEEIHKANEQNLSITTELVSQNPVIIKATVVTKKGTFTAYSAANPSKPMEKLSPIEVAETSAVGRAIGFSGYGLVEGIATADEVAKTPEQDVEDVFDIAQNKGVEPIEIRVAGPNSKKPGAKYKYNTATKQFAGWLEDGAVENNII